MANVTISASDAKMTTHERDEKQKKKTGEREREDWQRQLPVFVGTSCKNRRNFSSVQQFRHQMSPGNGSTLIHMTAQAHIVRRQGSGKLPFAISSLALSTTHPSAFNALALSLFFILSLCHFLLLPCALHLLPVAYYVIENDLSYCGIENKQHPKTNIANGPQSVQYCCRHRKTAVGVSKNIHTKEIN